MSPEKEIENPLPATENSTTVQKPADLYELKRLYSWQRKLLPWMIIMPTVLIGAFIFLATLQMRNFESYIYQGDDSEVDKHLPDPSTIKLDTLLDQKLGYLKLYTLTKMEKYSINRRYNQAGAVMMSGIYTKYLGFFTGMILAIVGAVFIISKLREDSSNLEGSASEQIRFKLISSSPGVIFGVLGTILMVTTIIKKTEVGVKDAPLYLNYYTIPSDNQAVDKALDDMDQSGNKNKGQNIDPEKAKNAKP